MKKYIAILLIILMLLQVAVALAADLICVRVDDVEYPADMVQADIDVMINSYAQAGSPLSAADRAELVQQVVEMYVYRGVIQRRLNELGLNELDENTLYAMREQAQQLYEADWKTLRANQGARSLTDEQLTAYLAEQGLTIESYLDSIMVSYNSETLLNAYHAEPKVTDEDVIAYYNEAIVKPCRERYEHNVPLFEEEVLYGSESSAYVPEGYRMLSQIVIPVPDALQTQLTDMQAQAEAVKAEGESIYSSIAAAAVAGDDVTELRAAYQRAVDEYDQLVVSYGQLWNSVQTETAPLTDELYARLQTGETFEQLAIAYGGMQNLVYHPDSEMWPTALKEAADPLTVPGDVSAPALCADGVHVLYYLRNMNTGVLMPESDEDMAMLRELTIQQKKSEMLEVIVEHLRSEYEIVTDLSVLRY